VAAEAAIRSRSLQERGRSVARGPFVTFGAEICTSLDFPKRAATPTLHVLALKRASAVTNLRALKTRNLATLEFVAFPKSPAAPGLVLSGEPFQISCSITETRYSWSNVAER
jgi:hypothetical protein